MKKISLLALLCTAGFALFAQDQPKLRTEMSSEVRFGIKGGVNIARLRTSDFPSGSEPNINNRTSWNAGFLVNMPLGEGGMALEPELLYSGQGAKLGATIGTTTQTFKEELHYLLLPVMLQWKSSGGFLIETGPQAGLLIKARQKGPGSTDVDNKDSYKKFDFSWGAGIGFLSRMGLGIGGRYNFGITNTLKDNTSYGSGAKLRNSVINIDLFYQFGAYK